MTVAELIAKLQEFPLDREVYLEAGDFAASSGELYVLGPKGDWWDDSRTKILE